MIRGSCHCTKVGWTLATLPEGATVCNCTACRRYGALWAYDHEGEGIHVTGSTTAYIRGSSIEFHFCPSCGCLAFWRAQAAGKDGRRRIAVNLRLSEPDAIATVPIDRFDGLGSFDDLPRDGRCVADYWF